MSSFPLRKLSLCHFCVFSVETWEMFTEVFSSLISVSAGETDMLLVVRVRALLVFILIKRSESQLICPYCNPNYGDTDRGLSSLLTSWFQLISLACWRPLEATTHPAEILTLAGAPLTRAWGSRYSSPWWGTMTDTTRWMEDLSQEMNKSEPCHTLSLLPPITPTLSGEMWRRV